MKKILALATVLAAALATPTLADHKLNHPAYRFSPDTPPGRLVVTVSCFRGPWKEIIWDHANPVFIDSLVNVGYSYESASAIANRICRDKSLVNDNEALRLETVRVLNGSPSYQYHYKH
ncbi:hypothetical protein [Oceaniglobus roseus]|uniref:hypothetical protein n=1 Tax=Oceaniglobus roseus TaxID=1737570 RepID=UPI000C7F6030|nr:hypothetical protein [Kandeliimicrobium roseum]